MVHNSTSAFTQPVKACLPTLLAWLSGKGFVGYARVSGSRPGNATCIFGLFILKLNDLNSTPLLVGALLLTMNIYTNFCLEEEENKEEEKGGGGEGGEEEEKNGHLADSDVSDN